MDARAPHANYVKNYHMKILLIRLSEQIRTLPRWAWTTILRLTAEQAKRLRHGDFRVTLLWSLIIWMKF